MERDFNSRVYKKARNAYMVQCTLEYLVTLLMADAFLAKLLTAIGVSDYLVGIISSFTSLAFIFQLFSILLVKVRITSKNLVMIFDTISILFFMTVYLVPFLPVSAEAKRAIVVASVMLGYMVKYLISSIYFKWANSYVEPSLRAVYSAKKEMISLISGIIFTAVFGYIIDKLESIGCLNGAFLFISVNMLFINIGNFICLKSIKRESTSTEAEIAGISFGEVLKNTFVNRNFRNVIIMESMQKFAVYFTIGFMGVYKTKDLAMSIFLIQLINIVANIMRMLLSQPFAKYSDKKSFAKGMEVGMILAAVAFFVNIFTSVNTWYLVIIYTVLYNISLAGTNANSFNISYSYVPLNCMTQAMSIKNSISGLSGFAASLLGGVVVNYIQSNNNMIFGIHIYAQQVLSAVSFAIIIIAVLFTHFVIAKQKVKIQ